MEPKNRKIPTVVSCFLDYKSKVLLLKRAKKDSQYGLWGIPGGKQQEKESSKEALLREIKEELSLELLHNHLQMLYKSTMENQCDGEYFLHIYYAKLLNPPQIILNASEHSEFAWTRIENFKEYPLLFCQGQAFDLASELLKQRMNYQQEEREIENEDI
jgi:8-oxo-dGTP diphosphatase